MRIIELHADNVKRLSAVNIRPDRSVVRIEGENGHGKSSVLDSIMYALAGAAGHPTQPIRQGAERATIRLDLGDDEDVELTVIRRFSASGGTSLVVEGPNNTQFKSPQAMLDKMLGQLTFDPLAFARQPARLQAEQLRGIVQVDVDLDELDRIAADLRTERTDVGRRAKSATERANLLRGGVSSDMDVTPIDVSSLVQQLEQAGTVNEGLKREVADRTKRASLILTLQNDAEAKRAQAARLVAEAAECERRATEEGNYLDSVEFLGEPIDTTQLSAGIQRALAENREREAQARARVAHLSAVDEQTALSMEYENMTAALDLLQRTKEDAIARADMPVPGLSFGDGEILYNDVPFAQASSAEQIRVATAIGMAGNPKLRILFIKDGSLLDTASMATLEEMADTHDFQVWVERVGASGVGIELVDGAVASINGEPVVDDAYMESIGA